ncbi:MAG: DHHA1 domain-containing protein [Candidatus Saccharibacteria bacterium]|nr:DHHA1 domain-containing protein [Candidatus Saccharibacteria bacterium]
MSRLFARLLEKRGFSEEFLEPKWEDLAEPEVLPDMEKAVERIIRAGETREKVIIYGDYDVDGVTASAEMAEILEAAGVSEFFVMLPDRFLDGYGMSMKVVEKAKEMGATLVVTVDCGSNNGEVIKELRRIGVDTVVTDHHEISGEMPEAVAVVNPKRKDFREKVVASRALVREPQGGATERKIGVNLGKHHLEDLCGAGVAFYVARMMVKRGKMSEAQMKWMTELAMMGTICDSMVMLGDNRIIARFGLMVIKKTRRVGLRELMRNAGVKMEIGRVAVANVNGANSEKVDSGAVVNTGTVGFQIGPRLNAAGRIEKADLAYELLTTKSKVVAVNLAMKLEELNKRRREMQTTATDEVEERGVSEEPVMVVEGEWHEGVLGIIAGRLTEKYRKPSFVLTEVEDGYKGSGRSFGDFNLAKALEYCREELVSGGGHAAAAGVKVRLGRLAVFREKINEYYRSLNLSGQEKYFRVHEDLSVGSLKSLSVEFLEELKKLEPFGVGNEEPIFLLNGVVIEEVKWMGATGRHLSMLVKDDEGARMRLVGFNAEEEWGKVRVGEKVRVWVRVEENWWRGSCSVEGKILGMETV